MLIRAADPRRARLIQARLAEAGLESAALAGPGFLRPSTAAEDVVLLDLTSDAASHVPELRNQAAGPLALIGWADGPLGDRPDGVDALVPADAEPAAIIKFLRAAARFGVARASAELRRGGPQASAKPAPARLLFVGQPDPFFLALDRQAQTLGAQLHAVITSFAAFEALHDLPFDAAILNAGREPAAALSLCGALRRNAELQDLPLAFLGAEDAGQARDAINRGASLSMARGDLGALHWLLQQIELSRAHLRLRKELQSLREAASEAHSPLVHAGFFETELIAQARAHQVQGRPLAVAAFRLSGLRALAPPEAARGFRETASLALRLVRAEDLAGRIGEDMFAIVLPNTDREAAEAACRRICAVAECTAFSASHAGSAVTLLTSVASLMVGESGAGLLARAVEGLGPTRKRAQP